MHPVTTNRNISSPQQVVSRAVSWLKHKILDHFPVQTADRVDPRRIFVRMLLNVAPDQRASVLEYGLPCIVPQRNSDTKDQLIQLVNDKNPRIPLSRSMLPFVTPAMCVLEAIETMVAIAAVPMEKREVVALYTDQLIPQNNKVDMIRAIDQIPVNQLNHVVIASLALITQGMNVLERVAIVEGIVAIPQEDLDEVMGYAQKFITPQMDSSSRRVIIEAVAAVPAQDRPSVMTSVNQLIPAEMDDQSIKSVIEALAATPLEEREEVVFRAYDLLKNKYKKRSLTVQMIEAVASNADRLILGRFPDIDYRCWLKICSAISAISALERREFIKKSDFIDPREYAYTQ